MLEDWQAKPWWAQMSGENEQREKRKRTEERSLDLERGDGWVTIERRRSGVQVAEVPGVASMGCFFFSFLFF